MVCRLSRHVAVGLALAASALLAAPVSAQDAAPTTSTPPRPAAAQPKGDAPLPQDEVVVRGRRMSEVENELRIYIQKFVGSVAAPVPGRGFARWHEHVCVGVNNLQTDAAQYIVDRISALALEVGLEPGEPGCTPEVLVVFATNAKELATNLVKKDKRAFLPGMGLSGTALDRDKLDEFAKSDKPVRWWQVSMPIDPHTGQRAIRMQQDDCSDSLNCGPWINVEGPSRIHSGTRDDFRQIIIIVDGTKLHGTTWQQLGDYLAVISLAQVNPDGDTSAFDSILNLFKNPAAYSGLTDWDRSYVKALYKFDQERNPFMQQVDLVSVMATQERDRAR